MTQFLKEVCVCSLAGLASYRSAYDGDPLVGNVRIYERFFTALTVRGYDVSAYNLAK